MTNIRTIWEAESVKWDVLACKMGILTVPTLWGVKPLSTVSMLENIFDDTDKAMSFSYALEKTFQEEGIELKDDETYACVLFVVKKPKYLSEVLGPSPEPFSEYSSEVLGPSPEPFSEYTSKALDPNPEPAGITQRMAYQSQGDFPFMELVASAWRSIRYKVIMEPAIMKKMMKKREDDKIDY